ncbi:MAG: TldD/PmbA family protein [Pseudomonadota bacterium]
MTANLDDSLSILSSLVDKAKTAGADAADAILVRSESLSLAQRLKQPERLERSESNDIGLRVLIGKRQAIVSTTDIRTDSLDALVERVVAMAKTVPEDEFCGIADPDQITSSFPTIEMTDPDEPSSEQLIAWAKACEEAALDVDGISNSEGAEASWGKSTVALAASNGFAGGYAVSRHSLGVSVLAGEGTAMERDYDYSSTVFAADLEDPATVGRRAAERTVRRLNARKVKTQAVPVVYDPRVSSGLLGHLVSAINGPAVARGTSFLRDKMGEAVMAAGLTVVDDPHRDRGLRSKPFDGEGIANQRRELVSNGVLQTWLLDLRSARQLGLTTTGHASRGTSSPPGPSATNLYLEPGSHTPAELMADIKDGLYITELLGFGVNGVTGDYSRGAGGFWIENGEIAYPVSELTVAGNLKDMFMHMTPANDLEFRYGTNAPTIRVDGMTVAGG